MFGKKKRQNFRFRPKNVTKFRWRPFFFGEHLMFGKKNVRISDFGRRMWLNFDEDLFFFFFFFFFFFLETICFLAEITNVFPRFPRNSVAICATFDGSVSSPPIIFTDIRHWYRTTIQLQINFFLNAFNWPSLLSETIQTFIYFILLFWINAAMIMNLVSLKHLKWKLIFSLHCLKEKWFEIVSKLFFGLFLSKVFPFFVQISILRRISNLSLKSRNGQYKFV